VNEHPEWVSLEAFDLFWNRERAEALADAEMMWVAHYADVLELVERQLTGHTPFAVCSDEDDVLVSLDVLRAFRPCLWWVE
jgi:hypothetical protein